MSKQGLLIAAVCLAVPTICAFAWVSSAAKRLEAISESPDGAEEIAVASASDAAYCSPQLKKILRRVLQSCGLLGKGGTRGCKPLDAKNVASVGGRDFNALFKPMKSRGGIVQFDSESADLDLGDQKLIEDVFTDQRGASYFFVVARASPEGEVAYNRNLSQKRAEAVLGHLQKTFDDPDLEREVGLLWLGEEFAQLDREFCDWRRSGEASNCNTTHINRGAFVAWIDCQL